MATSQATFAWVTTMNILFLTGYVGDADIVVHELGKVAPHIHIETAPITLQAVGLIGPAGRYDAVLLDPHAAGGDCQNVIAHIREQDQSITVVVMTRPAEGAPPLRMLEAGADDYIVKRPQYYASLPSLLQAAIERRRTSWLRLARPMKVLVVGDFEGARRLLSRASNIELEAAQIGPDGSLRLSAVDCVDAPFDAAILDSSGFGPRILQILKELQAVAPNVPAVLLLENGDGNLAAQATKLGADGCVVKSGNCFHFLASALENAIRRRRQVRTEDRFAGRGERQRPHGEAAGLRAAVEAENVALQARIEELEEKITAERAVRVEERRELERRAAELAAGKISLEKAQAGMKADLAQFTEEQGRERERREKLLEELNQQRAARIALEEILRAEESRQAALTDTRRTEKAELQSMHEELERQRATRQALEEALRAAEARLTQLAEVHRTAQAELDTLNKELGMQRSVRLALEEALRTAHARQRKELFTDLAAETVQVFARLIGPVRDCGRLLAEILEADDPRRARAARLVDIAAHAESLARRILDLDTPRESLNLNQAIEEMKESLRALAGEKVELITILAPSLPRVRVDRPAAEGLLASMVTCARDAMPAGGTVVVEAARYSADAALLPRHPVLLTVTASGDGVMTPGEITRLERLVAECGGQLSISGSAELGATIEVSLPADV